MTVDQFCDHVDALRAAVETARRELDALLAMLEEARAFAQSSRPDDSLGDRASVSEVRRPLARRLHGVPGKVGGRARTRRKLKAIRENLALARAATKRRG
jgi:hypothetical protein